MAAKAINFQNTPKLDGVKAIPVSFSKNDNALKGILYMPDTVDTSYPEAIVTGAWTTVKEQMAGTYARELVACGFAALAFDFTGWGESDGVPRDVSQFDLYDRVDAVSTSANAVADFFHLEGTA